jgi:hypothetical protein
VENENRSRNVHVNNGSCVGGFWFAGWLFTLASVKLIWWQALLALVVWPYYLGQAVKLIVK